MKKVKMIFVIALAIIFVGTTFTAIFGAGRALGQIFKVYIFKYQECEYKAIPIARDPGSIMEEQIPEKNCFIDYNQAKRDIAEGLALLIITLPIIYFSQRTLRKTIKEVHPVK